MSAAPRSRPLRWPWAGDTVLDRSRRLGRSYRAALADLAPDAAARIDRWAVDHGETWIVAEPIAYDPEELLTPEEAAEYATVRVRTIYQWHQRGLPYVSTPDGIRIRAGDLVRWDQRRRQQRAGRAV